MSCWWSTNSARLKSERSAVEKLASESEWFELTQWKFYKFRFSAEGIITANGIKFPIRLIYPDHFPSVPAWVEPQDPEVRWSKHQHGEGGSLCLELRPDNWTVTATGADMLKSAYNLLSSENAGNGKEAEIVPSAHNIGEVQSYDWGRNPMLISKGCLERIRRGESKNIKGINWFAVEDLCPIYISDDSDKLNAQRPPESDITSWRLPILVMVKYCAPPKQTPKERNELATSIDMDLSPFVDSSVAVLVIGKERFKSYNVAADGAVHERKIIVLPEETGKRSGRSQEATGKTVAIIGVGSVGSKIAEILLRSGITNITLVDGDVFLPTNIERHILDWRDTGFRKVKAVRRRLLNIVPGATINIIEDNLNWQRSAKTHAAQIELITDCHLMVDATGDVASSLMLGSLAYNNNIPFVSALVFEGGLGALIARSIPNVDPDYITARASYISYCDEKNIAPPPSGQGRYDALTDNGEPIVADDSAVTMASSHAARVILDILDKRIGANDQAWLLLGFREGWLFRGHGHNINLDVGPAIAAINPPDDAETIAFAWGLAKEALDEAQATT